MLSDCDRRLRVQFCKRHLNTPSSFWTSRISFYLDCVSFHHKLNPCQSARAPRRRAWMKKSEALKITGTGKHEGVTGRVVHFVVAIGFGIGLVICEAYDKLDGAFFAAFIKRVFPQAFLLCQSSSTSTGRLFLQDNDPSQTSKRALQAMKAINTAHLIIPPRSPDLNPIENIFACVLESVRPCDFFLSLDPQKNEYVMRPPPWNRGGLGRPSGRSERSERR